MFFLETERLKLIPLTNHQLQLLLKDRRSMELEIGLNPSQMLIDPLYMAEVEDALINFMIPKTAENPDNYQWYTNWEIVIKSTNTSIGGIGMGFPNDAGESETGFMLDQNHHSRGYASEALQAMTGWAFSNPDVLTVIAHTFDDNFSTQKLLERTGFVKTGAEGNLLKYARNRSKV